MSASAIAEFATFGGLSGIRHRDPRDKQAVRVELEVVQSAQEPLSPRLATGYSPGGCTTSESRDITHRRAAMEALRTQIDKLGWEKTQLEVENRRLREAHPETVSLLDAEEEIAHYKAESERLTAETIESEQALRKLCGELEASAQAGGEKDDLLDHEQQRTRELAERVTTLEAELDRQEQAAELQRYRAVDEERRKGEEQEERLVAQLRAVGKRPEELARSSGWKARDDPTDTSGREDSGETREVRDTDTEPPIVPPEANTASEEGRPNSLTAQLSKALLAQQLPPIQKFSGDEKTLDGETFQEWLEQFQMVAEVASWDHQTKLVNLTTRLQGQAYTFYRTCTPAQRADYNTLVTELRKRFTPVRIKAVQNGLFHDRKQKPQEAVDEYAQELRRLFQKAYPAAQRGSPEADEMGRSVLTFQFASVCFLL